MQIIKKNNIKLYIFLRDRHFKKHLDNLYTYSYFVNILSTNCDFSRLNLEKVVENHIGEVGERMNLENHMDDFLAGQRKMKHGR